MSDARPGDCCLVTTTRKAVHVLVHAREVRGGRPLEFFQNLVVYADTTEEAKTRVTDFLADQRALVVEFDEEELYEANPLHVRYGPPVPEWGVVTMTGRLYILPELSVWGRLCSVVAALVSRVVGHRKGDLPTDSSETDSSD